MVKRFIQKKIQLHLVTILNFEFFMYRNKPF